jgi:hypothetical protein
MKPEDKWLLIFGSGWVDWQDVVQGNYDTLFHAIPRFKLELNLESQRVRLKPHELIRVRLAATTRLHPVRASEDHR